MEVRGAYKCQTPTYEFATSYALDIDNEIEETHWTPFKENIANARIRDTWKIKFPEYTRNNDPKLTLTMTEKKHDTVDFFAENLTRPALEWFAGLEANSIDSFNQLVSVFLKQYSMFIEVKTSEAVIWMLT